MIYANPSSTVDAFLTNAPTGLTGSLGFEVVDTSGAVIVAHTTAGIAEITTGNYHKSFTAPASNGKYLVVWDASGVSAGEELLVGATLDQIANAIVGGTITVVNAVGSDGDISIIRGDDYLAADGRDLQWADGSWPDLTGASIVFTSRSGDDALGVSKAGAVITPSGTGKRIRVELTAAETSAHLTENYKFDIRATLADGHKVTLVQARMTVMEDIHP